MAEETEITAETPEAGKLRRGESAEKNQVKT